MVTRQAQLNIRQQQEPGPAVGRLRRAQLGRGPLERLLEEAERVLNRKAGDVGLPELGKVGWGRSSHQNQSGISGLVGRGRWSTSSRISVPRTSGRGWRVPRGMCRAEDAAAGCRPPHACRQT